MQEDLTVSIVVFFEFCPAGRHPSNVSVKAEKACQCKVKVTS